MSSVFSVYLVKLGVPGEGLQSYSNWNFVFHNLGFQPRVQQMLRDGLPCQELIPMLGTHTVDKMDKTQV